MLSANAFALAALSLAPPSAACFSKADPSTYRQESACPASTVEVGVTEGTISAWLVARYVAKDVLEFSIELRYLGWTRSSTVSPAIAGVSIDDAGTHIELDFEKLAAVNGRCEKPNRCYNGSGWAAKLDRETFLMLLRSPHPTFTVYVEVEDDWAVQLAIPTADLQELTRTIANDAG